MNLFGFGTNPFAQTVTFGSPQPLRSAQVPTQLSFQPFNFQTFPFQQTQTAQQQLGQGFASFLGAPVAMFPGPAFGGAPTFQPFQPLPNFFPGPAPQLSNPFAFGGPIQPPPLNVAPTSPFLQPAPPNFGFTSPPPQSVFSPFQSQNPFGFNNGFSNPFGFAVQPGTPFGANPGIGQPNPFTFNPTSLPGIPLGSDPFFHQNLDNFFQNAIQQISGVNQIGAALGVSTNPQGNGQRGDVRVLVGNRWDGVAPQRVTIHEQGRFSTRQHTDNIGGFRATEARFTNGEVGKTYTVAVQWADGTTTQRQVTMNQPGQLFIIDTPF